MPLFILHTAISLFLLSSFPCLFIPTICCLWHIQNETRSQFLALSLKLPIRITHTELSQLSTLDSILGIDGLLFRFLPPALPLQRAGPVSQGKEKRQERKGTRRCKCYPQRIAVQRPDRGLEARGELVDGKQGLSQPFDELSQVSNDGFA